MGCPLRIMAAALLFTVLWSGEPDPTLALIYGVWVEAIYTNMRQAKKRRT